MKKTPLQRFESMYTPEPNTGCWLWTERLAQETGYGVFYLGRQMGAHRASWILHRGAIPVGLHVLHSCDVRSCVNPQHLRCGTNAENVNDMLSRGRQARGVMKQSARLDDDSVYVIRRVYETGTATQCDLARWFGVTRAAIGHVVLRTRWAHVP